ncbi:MAG: transglutaminase TgpA family protein [Desulfohalobiaceae bacterium]
MQVQLPETLRGFPILRGFGRFTEQRATLAILLAAMVALVPHMGHLPLWVSLFCLGILGWRAGMELWAWKAPRRMILVLLAALGTIGVVLTYGRLLGREPGVALLAAMLALKPLEIKNHRDRMVTLFLCYFMSVTLALFHQNLATAVVMLTGLLCITGVLVTVNTPTLGLLSGMRQAGALVLQALPLAALFFFLFPRLPGSLWGVPEQSTRAVSGLSETLSFGSISSLALSGETAFRAAFEDEVPAPEDLYWRALVLTEFDGRTWSASQRSRDAAAAVEPPDIRPVRYSVTLEPHQKRMLMALDYPAAEPPGTELLQGLVLRSSSPVHKRVRYQMESYPTMVPDDHPGQGGSQSMRIHGRSNPEAFALARSWVTDNPESPQEVVGQALDYFRDTGFRYTLNPPLLGESAVDDFLFRTRQGYCGHYASAFSWLMRAAGIPSRVVAGYQGGTFNPVGGYLIVRQSDAHAWSEVWMEPLGWVRVDPTAAVAPLRIQEGVTSVVPQVDRVPLFGFTDGAMYEWLRRARFRVDALYNAWNQWVLYYDFSRQGSLLSKLGLGRNIWQAFSRVVLLGSGLFVLFMACMGVWLMRGRRKGRDEVVDLFRKFQDRLERAGIEVSAHEGPRALEHRVAALRPDIEPAVRCIVSLYVSLRYKQDSGSVDLWELKKAVQGFRPSRRPSEQVAAACGSR